MNKAELNIFAVRDADFGFGILPWSKGPVFQIKSSYKFMVDIPNVYTWEFEIPAGYQFDKASIPSFFWGPPFNYTPDGLCTVPALEHDFLCDLLNGGSWWLRERLPATKLVAPPASVVHEHFRRRLLEENVRKNKANLMGTAVRWFGPKGKAYFWQAK